MNSTSRAPAPAPLYTLGFGRNTSTSPTSPTSQSTPRSATTTDGWAIRGVMDRKDSSNSVSSTMSSASAASIPRRKKVSSPSSSNVNQYTHCGRHTDQYLFSGWSKVFNRKN
ncbi:hypothetical protein INS49_007022 [Diaporthe citri]|uniref:uncharacterized protein n=1 Tax=Diaporthe citri TaxID=83186 RepID=UPI001C7F2147|nr:uncharacterized protein INS49_007022 [Diaporthe citri]KAG6365411.1 hypothetical protein INS49_007022 [Diaporthe citri]